MNDASARPSMADVGKLASVSAQTVSRYFTGGYVGAQTRERIERAITALGYRHNRVARNLRVRRTDTIGFLIIGPLNYGNAEILTGVGTAARAAGLSVITTQLSGDPAVGGTAEEVGAALDHFLSFQVDGIIAGTPYFEIDRQLQLLADVVPIVTLTETSRTVSDSAGGDSYGAARLVMEHLLRLGHRRILHLAGPTGRIEAAERVRAYEDCLRAAGATALPLLECEEWNAASGAVHGRHADPDSFTAVFAANDVIALGFLGSMELRGFRAPRDFSIAGIDGMPDTEYFSPPLTTASIDFQALGTLAVDMLGARIRTGKPQPHGVVESALITRWSTAPGTAG